MTLLGWADPHIWTELTVFSILHDWVLWEASQEGEGKLQSSQLNEMDLEGWSLSRQEGMKIEDRTGQENKTEFIKQIMKIKIQARRHKKLMWKEMKVKGTVKPFYRSFSEIECYEDIWYVR